MLQRFERRLGGLVEGAFARVFKGAVEPVEIGSALRREAADNRRVLGAGRVLVPNHYVVELGQEDFANFDSYGPRLREELASTLRESIQERGWTTFGAIVIELEQVDDLETGMFRVACTVDADAAQPSSGVPTRPAAASQVDGERTAVFRSAASLVDESGRRYPLRQGATVLGRSEDADIRLPDVGISRRHARVQYDGSRALVSDLGSTNGTLVNGTAVGEETELRHGDRLQVGSTVLVLRMDG